MPLTILERGRRYLATAIDKRFDPDFRIEVGLRALRKHSAAMADVSLDDAQVLLAAVFGAVKWHERRAADGGHLGDCLGQLEDAMASLKLHQRAEEERMAA